MTTVCLEYGDCPHYHREPDGVGRCDANEMRSCDFELTQECKLYQEILKEWEAEK